MHYHIFEPVKAILGLIVGALIGCAFGLIQNLALRRNEKRRDSGALKTGWAVMPGSFTRVAYLMVALLVIQLVCPLLFSDGTQWWVSGGVCLGYGALLFSRLKQAH
jgi:hypothetical protein